MTDRINSKEKLRHFRAVFDEFLVLNHLIVGEFDLRSIF